jgi:hypothetical protein
MVEEIRKAFQAVLDYIKNIIDTDTNVYITNSQWTDYFGS